MAAASPRAGPVGPVLARTSLLLSMFDEAVERALVRERQTTGRQSPTTPLELRSNSGSSDTPPSKYVPYNQQRTSNNRDTYQGEPAFPYPGATDMDDMYTGAIHDPGRPLKSEAKQLSDIRDALYLLEAQLYVVQELDPSPSEERLQALEEVERRQEDLIIMLEQHQGQEWQVVQEASKLCAQSQESSDNPKRLYSRSLISPTSMPTRPSREPSPPTARSDDYFFPSREAAADDHHDHQLEEAQHNNDSGEESPEQIARHHYSEGGRGSTVRTVGGRRVRAGISGGAQRLAIDNWETSGDTGDDTEADFSKTALHSKVSGWSGGSSVDDKAQAVFHGAAREGVGGHVDVEIPEGEELVHRTNNVDGGGHANGRRGEKKVRRPLAAVGNVAKSALLLTGGAAGRIVRWGLQVTVLAGGVSALLIAGEYLTRPKAPCVTPGLHLLRSSAPAAAATLTQKMHATAPERTTDGIALPAEKLKPGPAPIPRPVRKPAAAAPENTSFPLCTIRETLELAPRIQSLPRKQDVLMGRG